MLDTGYPSSPGDVTLIDGVTEAMRKLTLNGYRLFIVSNQSGVGRGYFSEAQMWSVHERLIECLSSEGVSITESVYCTDAPDVSNSRRKPSPAMISDLIDKYKLEPSRCFMIGDKPSDVEAGCSAGCQTVLFGKDSQTAARLRVASNFTSTDWDETVEKILLSESVDSPPSPSSPRASA